MHMYTDPQPLSLMMPCKKTAPTIHKKEEALRHTPHQSVVLSLKERSLRRASHQTSCPSSRPSDEAVVFLALHQKAYSSSPVTLLLRHQKSYSSSPVSALARKPRPVQHYTSGGEFELVCAPARAMRHTHVGPQYVQISQQNQKSHLPKALSYNASLLVYWPAIALRLLPRSLATVPSLRPMSSRS